MSGTEKTDEFIVSINLFEIDSGCNVGKWRARFSISQSGKPLYHGAILHLAASRLEAEQAAAGEACRILSNNARLLY